MASLAVDSICSTSMRVAPLDLSWLTDRIAPEPGRVPADDPSRRSRRARRPAGRKCGARRPGPRHDGAVISEAGFFSIDEDVNRVDWEQAKRDLAADDFDNGRTAAALRRSFAHSQHVTFAWAADRVVGMARLLSDGVCNA